MITVGLCATTTRVMHPWFSCCHKQHLLMVQVLSLRPPSFWGHTFYGDHIVMSGHRRDSKAGPSSCDVGLLFLVALAPRLPVGLGARLPGQCCCLVSPPSLFPFRGIRPSCGSKEAIFLSLASYFSMFFACLILVSASRWSKLMHRMWDYCSEWWNRHEWVEKQTAISV